MTLGAQGLAIGWLSSWRTARAFPWPGFAGGPASLPRRFDRAGAGAELVPAPQAAAGFACAVEHAPVAGLGTAEVGDAFTLRIESAAGELDVHVRGGALEAARRAPGCDWRAEHRWSGRGALQLFIDGPAIELFVDGAPPLSVALPNAGAPFAVTLEDGAGRACPTGWKRPG